MAIRLAAGPPKPSGDTQRHEPSSGRRGIAPVTDIGAPHLTPAGRHLVGDGHPDLAAAAGDVLPARDQRLGLRPFLTSWRVDFSRPATSVRRSAHPSRHSPRAERWRRARTHAGRRRSTPTPRRGHWSSYGFSDAARRSSEYSASTISLHRRVVVPRRSRRSRSSAAREERRASASRHSGPTPETLTGFIVQRPVAESATDFAARPGLVDPGHGLTVLGRRRGEFFEQRPAAARPGCADGVVGRVLTNSKREVASLSGSAVRKPRASTAGAAMSPVT